MQTFLVIALLLATLAALIDFRTGHIPNGLTVSALVLLPAARVVAEAESSHGLGAAAWMQGAISLGGALACAFVPLALLSKGAIGGGDVKLFAALGAALGPVIGIEAEFYAFVAAGVVLPARLVYEGRLWKTCLQMAVFAVNPAAREKQKAIAGDLTHFFRMGPAIATGMLVTVVLHWRMI